MVQLQPYCPPIEPFCIWRGGFLPEECTRVRGLGDLYEFERGRVGGNANDPGAVDENVRDTAVAWFPHNVDTSWIFERMSQLCARINFDKFQLDLAGFEGLQYTKYAPQGHYDWHHDVVLDPPKGLFRKLSLVVMLSDQEEFEGGEFLLAENGDNARATMLTPALGDVVAFYSHIPHKVAPVISGSRVTLVTWAMGAKWR